MLQEGFWWGLGHQYEGIGNLNQEELIEVDYHRLPIIKPENYFSLDDNSSTWRDFYVSAKKHDFPENPRT